MSPLRDFGTIITPMGYLDATPTGLLAFRSLKLETENLFQRQNAITQRI